MASDFEALSSCTGLQHLDISKCVCLRSLAPFTSCRKLKYLDVSGNTIPSLEPLWGLQELQYLNLWNTHTDWIHRGPPELGPLTRVEHLKLGADEPPRVSSGI